MSQIFENSPGDGRNDLAGDELIHLLPDYINGHLDADTTARMESALLTDQDLRTQYEFQVGLQVALRSHAEVADSRAQLNSIQGGSGFAAITDRLEESAGQRLLNRLRNWIGFGGGDFSVTALAPVFVLVVAVGLFAGVLQNDPELTVNDFETRMSLDTFDQPTIRILAQSGLDPVAFSALLRDHGLQLVQNLPDNVVEVTPVAQGKDLTLLMDALLADDRVVFAKIFSAGAAVSSDSR